MPQKIAAGQRNKRIVIERNVGSARDAAGHKVESWQPYAKRWAEIKQLSGRELWKAQQVQPDATHQLTFQFAAGADTAMRIRYGTRYFGILSLDDGNEDGVEHVCICKEAV